MDDETLLRYSRHIMLAGLDIEGQERLRASRVLIVGMGGLGSPAALYLAASGVGRLRLVDFDRVELSNLQRQIIHASDDIGRLKIDSARKRLQGINPGVTVEAQDLRLDDTNVDEALDGVDVILDGSDNFETRFTVNRGAVRAGIPLISGAVIRMEGQLAVFRPDRPDRPCYRCVFPDISEPAETCSETGVLAPLPGVVGSLQAVEALKLLAHLGEPLDSRLLTLDALTMNWRSFNLRRDPECPDCGDRAGRPAGS